MATNSLRPGEKTAGSGYADGPKSDWVAVESEFSGTSAPQIKPAKSAYVYFQSDRNAGIRQSLKDDGVDPDFAAVQRETSRQWKELDESAKAKYTKLAAADKARFQKENEERDREYERQQEERRKQREENVEGMRERKPAQVFVERKVVHRELTAEQKREKAAQKKARDAKVAETDKQLAALNAEKAAAAQARLSFLLQQADIFQHFGSGVNASKAGSGSAASAAPTSPTKTGTKGKGKSGGGTPSRRERQNSHADEELMEDDEAPVQHKFTESPPYIKFGKMRPYQIEGLNWMVNLGRLGINGILADEMGLGKTLQTISVLGYGQWANNISGPHIVIVPKSTLSNWMKEIGRWCPSLRPVRLHGTKEERAELLATVLQPGRSKENMQFDICLTTYEIAIKEKSTLAKHAWQYLVIDEAHRIKNEASLFSGVVRTFNCRHRLLITGTPLQNNLHELWALLNFLLPDVFSSAEQFDEWFNLDVDDAESKERMIGQLHKILRPFMLRRLKADVEKSLPPKKETLLYVGMSEMQRDLYKKILQRDKDSYLGKASSGRTQLLNICMQLRKAVNHPYLFDGLEDMTLDPMGEHLVTNSEKFMLLDKLLPKLKERGSRVLIFSQMTRVLDILDDYFRMPGREYDYCRIDGNTSYEDRENQIEEFNEPNSSKFIFMLSTRAGGLGINLYTADIVILFDSDWNPQSDLQAQDRAHRIGQKKTVKVYRFVTDNTIEQKVIERAQQKLKLDAMVVQQGRLQEKSAKVSKDEMLEMIKFGADTVFRTEKGKSISDADIDHILSEGEKRTADMMSSLEEHSKGDLLDFKLDGGINTQEFEGVDYAKARKEAEEQKRKEKDLFLQNVMAQSAISEADSMGKRERKTVKGFTIEEEERKERQPSKKRSMLPKVLRLPPMHPHQLYDSARLQQLQDMEEQRFLELTQMADSNLEELEQLATLLDPELQQEKERLLAMGFGGWSKTDYGAFVRASAQFGEKNYLAIAQEVGKPDEEVRRYSQAFWSVGSQRMPTDVWMKAMTKVDAGKKKLEAVQGMIEATRKKVERFANPWETMTFKFKSSRGPKEFTPQSNRYLLTFVQMYGYGNWDRIHQAVRACHCFKFDYWLRSRTREEVKRQCERLMKEAEKENQELVRRSADEEKQRQKEEAERVATEEKERIESAERKRKIRELDAKIAQAQKGLAEFRKKHKAVALPSSGGAAGGKGGGATGGGGGGAKGGAKGGAAAAAAAASGSGGGSSSSSSGGGGGGGRGGGGRGASSKGVPPELMPELARYLQAAGSTGMAKLTADFQARHPQVSKRQLEMQIKQMAAKNKTWSVTPSYAYLLEEGAVYDAAKHPVAAAATGGGGGGADGGQAPAAKKAKKEKDGAGGSGGASGGGSGKKRKASPKAKDKDGGGEEKKKAKKKKKPPAEGAGVGAAAGGNGEGASGSGTPTTPSIKKPKKQRSAYIHFSLHNRKQVKQELGPDADDRALLARLREKWAAMSTDEKDHWNNVEKEDAARYEREMAEYNAKTKAAEGN
eukprot:g1291.t1